MLPHNRVEIQARIALLKAQQQKVRDEYAHASGERVQELEHMLVAIASEIAVLEAMLSENH